jgi:hypothetical protein
MLVLRWGWPFWVAIVEIQVVSFVEKIAMSRLFFLKS